MKSDNNLSCPRYNNLIISILTLVFCLNFNQEKIVSLKGSSNSLRPIYEINNEVVLESINNVTTAVVTKKEVQSQNTYHNYYVRPSYNSLTGANLVNYAKKYLGLPYIPAGSSLASGTDCSGFTRLIFQEFGIGLGRTVASQLYSGSYVAKEDLRPGDLVFYGYSQGYSSHVAIYVGDGLIIHESNPRDGVKISSVNIMVYQTARRLITENVVSNVKQVEEVKNDNHEETKEVPSDTKEIINDNNNSSSDTSLDLKKDEKIEEIKKEETKEDIKNEEVVEVKEPDDVKENLNEEKEENNTLTDVKSSLEETITDTNESTTTEIKENNIDVDNSTN